jgi:voltage-gated potassium channel
MLSSAHPWRFLLKNWVVLMLSIPYHTLFAWLDADVGHNGEMVLGAIVMLRAVMALYITLRWLIVRRTTRLLWAYIATVVVCTYFAALFFYEYEAPVNSAVHGFGDALWWACMNMTTVGAEIFPVTAIGKVICVVLPIIGMAMFPVFTVYITTLYTSRDRRGTTLAENDTNQNQNKR